MTKTIKFSLILASTVFLAHWAQAGLIGDLLRPGRPIRPDRPERIQYVSAGEVRVPKIIDQDFHFQGRWDERVMRLQLVGLLATVKINSAHVEFSNGEIRQLPELIGSLRQGRRIGAYLEGRSIREVVINATSESLIGSRAQFRLELGLRR